MIDRKCATCMWHDDVTLVCRYRPPSDFGIWPMVAPDDWCSKHEARPTTLGDDGDGDGPTAGVES